MFYVSLYLYGDHRDLHVLTHSFPTRRSSDLLREAATWYVVGGRATGSARAAKLAGLKARLFGGDPRALSLIVSSETGRGGARAIADFVRSEEHTSELQSLMRISYAVFCLKKKKQDRTNRQIDVYNREKA